MIYRSNVSNDRRTPTSTPETAGHQDAHAFASAHADQPMRDVLVAGGLRGFTARQMFPEAS